MDTALIIVDIQNDYFPGGKMELAGPMEASLAAQRALEAFRAKRLPVYHIQHISTRPGATFFLPDTEGVKIHANVAPLAGEAVIQKNFPNAFRATPLLEKLQGEGVKNLVVCGMMTQMCIDATTRAAFDLGFQCTLLHDACAARALSFGGTQVPAEHVHKSFLAALGSVYAKVVSAGEIAASL